ncbi:conserved hypothetical protein [metagenome]|uniref:DUF1707 domain-containing protein n=1 Tax=metagenome TaxID=256318 RepID=A0A2P2CFH2_9ZZZZ
MSAPDPRLRISDDDRERAMADLAMHYADGRLEHEEYDERLDAIWTARTRADLALLFSDLPRPQVAYPPAKPAAARRRQGFRLPLLPVLALLVALSVLTGAPLWLLVFPLMFFARGRRGGCAPAYGHGDYRRPRGHHGW